VAGYTSSSSLLPPVVKALLIANVLMYLLEQVYGGAMISTLALWPPLHPGVFTGDIGASRFRLLQLVSYSFLHGSMMHLLLNMYALWLFGTRMENVWGSAAFTVYYFVCVVGAALVQLLVSTLSGGYYPTVGASGGIFGLLLAFGMRFPNEVLMLVFPPVALPAKWFVTIYAGIELFAGVTGTEAGVAHFAHLGGMLFGYLLIRYWRLHPPGFRR
jgi:membrane associated rhomboid family serine protease